MLLNSTVAGPQRTARLLRSGDTVYSVDVEYTAAR